MQELVTTMPKAAFVQIYLMYQVCLYAHITLYFVAVLIVNMLQDAIQGSGYHLLSSTWHILVI